MIPRRQTANQRTETRLVFTPTISRAYHVVWRPHTIMLGYYSSIVYRLMAFFLIDNHYYASTTFSGRSSHSSRSRTLSLTGWAAMITISLTLFSRKQLRNLSPSYFLTIAAVQQQSQFCVHAAFKQDAEKRVIFSPRRFADLMRLRAPLTRPRCCGSFLLTPHARPGYAADRATHLLSTLRLFRNTHCPPRTKANSAGEQIRLQVLRSQRVCVILYAFCYLLKKSYNRAASPFCQAC